MEMRKEGEEKFSSRKVESESMKEVRKEIKQTQQRCEKYRREGTERQPKKARTYIKQKTST